MRCFDKAILVASVALCFNLSAFSQDITLKANNITVKEAIEQIKNHQDIHLSFHPLIWIRKACLHFCKRCGNRRSCKTTFERTVRFEL